MSDLVKGLREAAAGNGGLDYGDLWAYCDEAADEIERLRAELAEARRDAEAARADYRCALQYIERLRNERDAAVAHAGDAARGET
jgi:hypothetical protein